MNNVILDSWTFQSVGELFANGYDHERTGILVATDEAHEFIPIAHGELQLQAVVDLLTHVVLRDTLILDRQFIEAWEIHVDCFGPISDAGIVLAIAPLIEGQTLIEQRQRIVKELCVTETLRAVQEENERTYGETQQASRPYESQIIWGGAGMLARSADRRLPYVGHPLRQRFIESTKAWRTPPDPTRRVIDLVNAHKAAIYSTIIGEDVGRRARLMLPAVAAEVITRAEAPEQLFEVALDLRDKYRKLRGWLGELRTALEEEDTAKLIASERVLNALAKDVARQTGKGGGEVASLDIAVNSMSTASTMTITSTISALKDAYERRFTVRHDLLQLMKAPAGERALEKLGRMFGKEKGGCR